MTKQQQAIELIDLVYKHAEVRKEGGKIYANNLDVKSFIIDLCNKLK